MTEVRKMLKRNKGLLNRDLNDDMILILRNVLNSDLSIDDKENALSLLLKCKGELKDKQKIVNGFILNKQVREKSSYSRILAKLKIKSDKKCSVWVFRGLVSAIKGLVFLKDEEYETRIDGLLNSPDDYHYFSNYIILNAIFEDEVLRSNPDKLFAILDVLFVKQVNDVLNGEHSTPYLLEILKDFRISTWSNEEYKKMLSFCLDNANWHLIYSLLKQYISGIRLKPALDYYRALDKDFITKWRFVTMKTLDTNFVENPLFSFPIKERILGLEVEEYARQLNTVATSQYPVSTCKVLSCTYLSNQRKTFVLDLVARSSVQTDEVVSSVDKKLKDGLDIVAEVATSDIARYLQDNEFEKVLNYIEITLRGLSKDEPGDLERCKVDLLLELFSKGSFYATNMNRFTYLISLIKNSNEKYVINQIIDIATSPNSLGYTDEELETLVHIIESVHDDGFHNNNEAARNKYHILKYLFKNNSVPFMDRSCLFSLALTSTETHIKEITAELNKEGLMNRNICALLGGANPQVGVQEQLENEKNLRFVPIEEKPKA